MVAATVAVGGAAAYGAAQTDHTAPILTFAGAILVALITAFTTNRRQRHQLEAESKRQQSALDAERDRLRLQLAHEREMADLADARKLLDDAAVALHDADYAIYEVDKAHTTHGPYVGERASETVAKLMDTTKLLDGLSERMAVRLGPDADAVTHFRAAREAVLAVYRRTRLPAQFTDAPRQQQALPGMIEGFHAARAAFLAAAAKTVGVTLP